MKRILILFVFCSMQILGTKIYAFNFLPYSIKGDFEGSADENSSSYTFSGQFDNKSEKPVSSFTVVFYVFDQDGNCPLQKRNNVVCMINESIPSGSNFEFNINMDEYLHESSYDYDSEEDEEREYRTEYLYVSRICYEDGTEWSDPFGLEAF